MEGTRQEWNTRRKGWKIAAPMPAAEQRCLELGEEVRGIRVGFLRESGGKHAMHV